MKVSKKTLLIGIVVVALVAALLFSAYLNININNSLQSSLKKNRNAFNDGLFGFRASVDKATRIDEPNEDNIEALIKDLWYEMFNAWMFLRVMEHLNPELSGYEKPLYFVDRFIEYTFLVGQSSTGEPNVRSVLEDLLGQAKISGNYSIVVTAFKELDQPPFKKMRELSFEVAESFYTPFNATRLGNTVNMVEELQRILSQWTDKYENV